jgi:protein-S-isoprenylcysteine O-methyltransferase Ste14
MLIMAAIVCVGFWAPWIQFWGIGSRITLLEWLALAISRLGLLSFTVATPVVILVGSLCAAIGAMLRISGAAWLGHGTVLHAEMQSGVLMADGPYRYVRNPLYLGLMFMIAAIALLMPASGALFVLLGVPLFLLILIQGEEKFLSVQIGEPYLAYMRCVPRLVPRLRGALPPAGQSPQWLTAVLSEINPIGVFITLAFFSWTYNNRLMIQAILVTFGVSLVMRALLPARA